MTKYTYTGDVSICHGGMWLDLSIWDHEYVTCVRVTDLDSAIGFSDAYLIERGSIYLGNHETIKRALDCSGWPNETTWDMSTDWGKVMLCEALLSYSGMDNDHSESVVIGPEADMESREGWKADRRLRSNVNLRKWVMREYGIHV
jgi:hypothetical protein